MPSPDRNAGGTPDDWKAGGGFCLIMSICMLAVPSILVALRIFGVIGG